MENEQKKSEQKTAQVLYMTVILVLVIMAVAVGLTTAAGKRSKPVESAPTTSTSTPVTAKSAPVKLPARTSEQLQTVQPPQSTAPVTVQTPPTVQSVAEADAPIPTLPVFIMPTIGNVSKGYTVDTPVWSNTMEDYRTHDGIDICAAVGEGVMAAADGIVTEVYAHPMMGTTVVISHDGDAESVYQNLAEEVAVSVGDTVKSGAVLGAIGESALIEIAEEPHLHFSMRVGGKSVNPLDYIASVTMTVIYDE